MYCVKERSPFSSRKFFSTGRVGLKLLLLFYLLSWCSEAENNFEKIFSNVSVMAKTQLVALIKKTRPQGHQQMYIDINLR